MAGYRKGRITRIFLRVFLVLAVFTLVLILVASPLARYLIQKYDTKYTGREITVRRVFINPLAGYMSLGDFRMFEAGSDSVFLYVKKFAVNISLVKIISGTYQVSSLKIDRPEVKIVQTDSIFNFTDLLQKFAEQEKDTTKPPPQVNVLNIKVKDGAIRYEKDPLRYALSEINLSSPGMRWNKDSINADFSLRPGGSYMNGDIMMNKKIMDYRLSLNLKNFDFAFAEQFLRRYVKDALLKAGVNLRLMAAGNIKDPMSVRARGLIEVDDFHLGRSGTDFLSFEKFIFGIRDADLKNKKLYFDSIYIDKPSILYQRYDTLDNFRRMMIPFISTADKAKHKDTLNLSSKLKDADYSISYFAIRDGNIMFNDYSIAEKFSMAFKPFNLETDSVSKAERRVKIKVKSGMKPFGSFTADLAMDPKNDKNFSFDYRLAGLSAASFNPYLITLTSFPLDRGQIEMHGKTSVINGKIRSLNHFLVIDPRDTKKAKGKDTKWVPMPLILSFVKERGGVIDYEIPITGDMNDPKFHLGDVISDLLRNILVKPPTTPYRIQVKNIEKEVEKQLNVTWKMRQENIDRDQEKFVEKIAGFLRDNPEAYINVQPVFYQEKEKENILFFEAKKKYFYRSRNLEVIPLPKDDSMKVEKLSTGDSAFLRYVNRYVKNPGLLTIQEKCNAFIGSELVNQRYVQVVEARKKAFMITFIKNGTARQVNILETKNEVPFNWFSTYRISYKGDVPEKLREAFGKLYEINSEPPRREYFQLKKK